MPTVPPNSLFSVLAFTGFLLAGLPLPWHMQSWNTGTCMFMSWTSLGCLILFVNSIVWNNNVINWAPVWCDISSRYLIGAGVGIPASALCIIRRLYYITKLQAVSVGKKEKRREVMVDILIGVGLPSVVMVLEYVVQVQRFSIIEQIGCYYAITNTLAAYFLISMWPLLIGLISVIYAVLTFHRAFQQRKQLKEVLNSGYSIGHRRYWCLMALCIAEIIFTFTLSLYVMIINAVDEPLSPYVSWSWLHSEISQIGQYPSVIWQSIPFVAIGVETTRWFYVLCAYVIFAFFGWGTEARGFYHRAFWSVCRRLGYSKPTMASKRITQAGRLSQVRDQQMESGQLHMPVRARAVRHDPLRSSLSAFEAPPRSASSLQLSVGEGSTENPPRLPSLSDLTGHAHISWVNMPTAPKPSLSADRCTRDSSQDAAQLV